MALTLQDRLDRLGMRLSRRRRIDGLWLGVFGPKRDDPLLDRVEAALKLIKDHDAVRYRRLLRDFDRIWIRVLPGPRGTFNPRLRTCSLEYRLVGKASVEAIASTIVHEAAHAQPRLLKFGYPAALQLRIEKICVRQQLAFADRVPGGKKLRKRLEAAVSLPESAWTPAVLSKIAADGELAAARYVGLPDWLTRSARVAGRTIGRLLGMPRSRRA